MITIDIRTKLVADHTRVFVVRPGAQYRLFNQFVDGSFVGPELPSLDLPKFNELSEIGDLAERVMRSVAIRRWYTSGQRDVMQPERDLEQYKTRAADRATSQFLRIVRAYFSDLKQGDLVLVPPANFRGMAQIGELSGPPNVFRDLVVPRYPGEPLSGRQVRWLASIPKSDLPAQTLDALQKPSALFLLERGSWPLILRRAYGSYSTSQEYSSRFEITSEKFKTSDDFHIQAFFNFIVKNTDSVNRGADDVLDFRAAAFADIQEIAPDLYTNVNSPGGLSLKSGLITPIVIATMLALAVDIGPEAANAAAVDEIVFGNSMAPANDPCVARVSEQVVTQLRLLGYDRWAEACRYVREASERTGFSSNVDIKTR